MTLLDTAAATDWRLAFDTMCDVTVNPTPTRPRDGHEYDCTGRYPYPARVQPPKDLVFTWLTAIPGAVLVAFTSRQVFQDLFHPTESGSISEFVGRRVFRGLRRWPSVLPLAGPLSLILVIVCWALLLALGFALIYWGSFPGGYHIDSGNSPDSERGFASALYFSLEVLITLGLGDFTPRPAWLRLTVTLEALIGLALVTASVSWIVLIYPTLSRMRTLARRASILGEAEQRTGIAVASEAGSGVLDELVNHVIRARVDLIHFPIVYYFHSGNRTSSLPHSLPQLVRFADDGSRPGSPDDVRLAAAALTIALNDLGEVLRERFVDAPEHDRAAAFRAYREHHVMAD